MKAEENTKFTFISNIPSNTIFFDINNEAIITLKGNGEIYVKGKLIENDIEVVNGMRELINRDRIHQINKDLDYQKELNIKQKHIENLVTSLIDAESKLHLLTQKQNDIDELVEALIHASLGNIERIDFDNYNLLIQKHTKK